MQEVRTASWPHLIRMLTGGDGACVDAAQQATQVEYRVEVGGCGAMWLLRCPARELSRHTPKPASAWPSHPHGSRWTRGLRLRSQQPSAAASRTMRGRPLSQLRRPPSSPSRAQTQWQHRRSTQQPGPTRSRRPQHTARQPPPHRLWVQQLQLQPHKVRPNAASDLHRQLGSALAAAASSSGWTSCWG